MIKYSYVCLYSVENENQISLLVAKKNLFAFWFDSTKEDFDKKRTQTKIKGKFYKHCGCKIEDHYFAFYPENNGCPLVNGEGKHCLVGGEVKKGFTADDSALEEFWEETGVRLDTSQFIERNLHDWPYSSTDSYGILFLKVSSVYLTNVSNQISENLRYVQEVDIPRVKTGDYANTLPRVFSNELDLVQVLSFEDALHIFNEMNPKLAGWFVEGLVSYNYLLF